MDLKAHFADKTTKPKETIEILSTAVLNGEVETSELIEFATSQKDPVKASCIEALEFATQTKPELLDDNPFDFVTENLSAKAPRIKWESAKVIGNTAKIFSKKLSSAIEKLIENTIHEGTVVRWSAAYALGEILKLEEHTAKLLPVAKEIMKKEEKASIQKIYQKAIKNCKK